MEKFISENSPKDSEKYIVHIESTGNYGNVFINTQYYDDTEFFSENILDYKLIKGKIFYIYEQQKTIITGVQFFYEQRATKEVISPGVYKRNNATNENVFEFQVRPLEYLVNFHVWVEDETIRKIQFITNKTREYEIGDEHGIKSKNQLDLNDAVILGTFGGFDEKLHSFGVYYVNRKSYLGALLNGFFFLKMVLRRHSSKKEEIYKNYNKYDQSQIAILKTCGLPNTAFLSVIKFLNL